VLGYNLPNLNGTLVLSHEDVIGIYNGTYRWWNSSVFERNNPDLVFPKARIVVIARGDKSGTTGIFTNALQSYDVWRDT